ncbi:MAG: hypothetical protein HUK14_02595 [Muribaculaceae bacterium]|nr:hypothetical protein [Muribaculaceae bacterium]
MQKFIVTAEGRFKFGNVALHRNLLSPGESCIGGGVYEFQPSANRMLLEGKSYDFGRVKWSWIDTLLVPSSLKGMEILYEDLPLTDFVNLKYID